jgi:polyhydroxyalkanoate synthesis repressor PhaR
MVKGFLLHRNITRPYRWISAVQRRMCIAAMATPMLVKKYSNRRLYDTDASRYVTLEELADKVKRGADVRVVDAKSDEDLTQQTLAQIILESRGAGKLLPVPLLVQLIRMGDDALAEFLGRYLSHALDLYLSAKHGAQTIAPYAPFATIPFAATNALARLLSGVSHWAEPAPQHVPTGPIAVAPPPGAEAAPVPVPPPPPSVDPAAEVAALRREMAELRDSLRDRNKSVRALVRRNKKG